MKTSVEAANRPNVGLWIDHHKAIFVSLADGQEQLEILESDLESHPRLAGGSRGKTPYGVQDVASQSKWDQRYQEHLHRYYRDVIDHLRNADRIYLLGPGAAKNELRKEIEKNKELGWRVVGIDTTDKMTDRQLAARVREYFAA